jgi:hypothetical protein
MGDIALSTETDRWHFAMKSADDTSIQLYETETGHPNSTWNLYGEITSADTGNAQNHNPGWMRWPDGRLVIYPNNVRFVYFGTGGTDFSSWELGRAHIE